MRCLCLILLLLAGAQPAPAQPAPAQPALARPVVAIIDSGVARTAELRSSLVAEYDMGSTPARPAFQPRYDHGTMVATILVREAAGPVDIISFRIDDPAGCPAGANPPCQPDPLPVARAIRRAISLDVDVINLSLTLADHPAIVAAVRDAAGKGIRVVMAAGNEGRSRPGNLEMARAGFPNAVLVGALDAGGRPWQGTNRPGAASPEGFAYVWQRGVRIPTSLADGSTVFGTGTSFAAPIHAARLLAEAPRARPVESRLADAPDPTPDGPAETSGAAAGRRVMTEGR